MRSHLGYMFRERPTSNDLHRSTSIVIGSLNKKWRRKRKCHRSTIREPLDDQAARIEARENLQRWSLDFVSDQLTDGRRFRIPTVIDNRTRECLTLVADTSLSGRWVARELDDIIRQRGRPETIVSDNGTEYTSNAISEGADDIGVA